ncbi:hypothetical protein U6A24_12840 [Aquimarina gracilis]|uniref:Lipoprotein n=1 Tax=Aquimarina gracilis TaxID=874422 RepID=A0ABU5ZWW9_9FLAO|nr:hypothetical protein [Aquimarina gracilis]MEB3346356.1 hypothetical protein [Aquimarina gracilis]
MKKLVLIISIAILNTFCTSPKEENKIDLNIKEIIDQKERIDTLQVKKLETKTQKEFSDRENDVKSEKAYYVIKNVNTFKNRFNNYCRKSSSSLRIRNITVQIGEVNNTFQYMFNSHIGLIGTLNKKDGSLKEVTMVGQGDGSLNSATNILVTMGGIINGVNPSLTPNERGQILKEIGFLNDNVDINNLEANTKRGEIKYWINSSKYLGIMFGASNVNN